MEKPSVDAGTSEVRKLVAIMFADMMGFTAMMQEDEAKAKLQRNHQQKTLETLIPKYNGTIVQFFGDGTLSMFDSAIDAVKSAIEIQKELQKEPKVKLRIGIHSGDVVYDTKGLYGDCVNLASRIESASIPGAVLISDKVFDEVKNQNDIKTTPLGKVNLKNVKKPVEVHAVTNEGLVVPTPVQVGVKANIDKSIAVLPFVNMSADQENEYFSDGISEEILNSLTHVKGIQVTARTSSFSFKGKNEDVREIGNKLGVANILEGTVRKAGKKVRINVQLINTVDGYHIWSEVYDRELEDIFEVQDEIARKIVVKLIENFALAEKKESVVKAPTENIDAYNLYLKGRYYWNRSNPEDTIRAIKSFEEAIQLDPEFALPYCALSYCYSFMGSSGLMPPAEAYPKAKDYTLKAIELDPNHAESHLSLATIKFYHNWDFDGAETSLKKAQDLGLNSSLFNQVHGWLLIAKGDFEKAIEKIQQALSLDPLSLPLMCTLGDAYSFACRFDDALAQFDKIIDMEPNCRRAFEGRGMTHLAMGEPKEAIKDLEHYQKLIGHPLKGLSGLGHAYATAGQNDKAKECVEKMKLREEQEPGVLLHMDYVFLYSGMKEFDLAFHYLNKTYEQRMGIACLGMIFCIRYPMLKELKSDPRFKDLLQKMNLKN
jgi:adenylate cyclase